ncbi:MAG: DUF188 domain-containing protein [Treponema sp.]|jgi:uncharacterized protein YaiI (UPF0178 family)|nr:DUF188 domain-containing protein [Treponema sp.]
MKILVDADSCPKPARALVLRSAARNSLKAHFAANRPIPGISGENAVMELCTAEEGSADDRIAEMARPGDLVLTRDIPLAARLVEVPVTVIDDRGRLYTRENIRERLSLRNFIVGLAENGIEKERSANYGKRELKAFADSFDRVLSRLLRGEKKR